MPIINLKSNTHSAMFQSVATVDRTKVHLYDPQTGSRVTLPFAAFPFCELDSVSIVTITVTRAEVQPDEADPAAAPIHPFSKNPN